MSDILNLLERKRDTLKSDYQSHLDWIRRMVADDTNVQSVTFEQNLINHAIMMNEAKSRLREIDMQIDILKLQ